MEQTTVDFISAASSIYHCFFFLDPPLVMSDVDPCDLRQPASRFPGIYSVWLSPSVVNLVTCTLQSGLNPIGWGRIPPVVGVIVLSQAAAAWRGVVCQNRMVPAIWGMTQHQDPSGYSLSSLPKASIPSLSSSVSSPLCLPFARDLLSVADSFYC